MIDFEFPGKGSAQNPPAFRLARIGHKYTTGTTLIFDDQTTATGKYFKRLSSYTPVDNDRVLVARISGTYVILGSIVD